MMNKGASMVRRSMGGAHRARKKGSHVYLNLDTRNAMKKGDKTAERAQQNSTMIPADTQQTKDKMG